LVDYKNIVVSSFSPELAQETFKIIKRTADFIKTEQKRYSFFKGFLRSSHFGDSKKGRQQAKQASRYLQIR
jgi:hypothetical protein